MNFQFRPNVTTGGRNHVSVGIAVVTRDAFAAGALPDPESDFHQDWLYWTRRMVDVPSTGCPQWLEWEADIRSGRRLRGGYALAMITENPANGSATQLEANMRLLWTQEA